MNTLSREDQQYTRPLYRYNRHLGCFISLSLNFFGDDMKISNLISVYFSPTGTTKKIMEAITRGSGIAQTSTIDMTLPRFIPKELPTFNNEIVIFGAPVYAGRLPAVSVKRFSKLKGNNTPAVLTVLYGNREFEDALIELKDIAVASGFIPIAGAAFIGEHSYSSPETPIAVGRPDEDDLARAEDFGKEIINKLESIDTLKKESSVNVPGNKPYKNGMPPSEDCARSDMGICTYCSTCVTLCPTEAITPDDNYTTNPKLCIMCCACVKGCPEGARYIDSDRVKKASKWLSENFTMPKQAKFFI